MWVCIEVLVLDSKRLPAASHIVLRGCGQRMLGRLQALGAAEPLSHATVYARAPVTLQGATVARGTPLLLPNDQRLSLCLQHSCSDTDEVFASVSLALDVHAFSQGVVCAHDAVSGAHAVFYASRLNAAQGPAQHRRVHPLLRAQACSRVCLARDIFVPAEVPRCLCADGAEAEFCACLLRLALLPADAPGANCGNDVPDDSANHAGVNSDNDQVASPNKDAYSCGDLVPF